MSQETAKWLNSGKVKVGNCATKPRPWWENKDLANPLQPSVYDGPVPLSDIRRDITKPLSMIEGESWSKFVIDGKEVWIQDVDMKTVARPAGFEHIDDPIRILGRHGKDYAVHDYEHDLMGAVQKVLDAQTGSVDVGAAIALKQGAQFFVQFEMPENVISSKVGESVRPYIFACTSVDGSLATTIGSGYQRIVCDNTGRMAIREAEGSGLFFRAKHTVNSLDALVAIREKLGIIIPDLGNALIAEIEELCSIPISNQEFDKILDVHDDGKMSLLNPDGTKKEKRGLTMAEKRRDTYKTLWNRDARVSPWKNTLHGWIQADNTYKTHFATVKGEERALRNYERSINGFWDQEEENAIATAKKVLGNKLVLTHR